MKFNKKSLIRLAILSSILGLNGFCGIVNAMEHPVIKIETPQPQEDVKAKKILECAICLGEETDPYQTTCGHVFCKDCLLMWLQRNEVCPLCRAPVHVGNLKEYTEPDIVPQEEEKAKEHVQKKEDCPICTEKKLLVDMPCCAGKCCSECVMKIGQRCPFCRNEEKFKKQADDLKAASKTQREIIASEKSSTIGLSNEELKQLGGKDAFYAGIQNKYASAQLQKLTDERANYLLDRGDVAAVERMFDDADSYRTAQELLFNDANDAILNKTENQETFAINYNDNYGAYNSTPSCGQEYGPISIQDDRFELFA